MSRDEKARTCRARARFTRQDRDRARRNPWREADYFEFSLTSKQRKSNDAGPPVCHQPLFILIRRTIRGKAAS